MRHQTIINKLLHSHEPSIRCKFLVNVLGRDLNSHEVKDLQQEMKNSRLAKELLANRTIDGRIVSHRGVYYKWQGAHWILNTLADLGYRHDEQLAPVRDQILDHWLRDSLYTEFIANTKAECTRMRAFHWFEEDIGDAHLNMVTPYIFF